MPKTKKIKINMSDQSRMEILKQGMAGEFWSLILNALEESVEDLQNKADSDEMQSLTPEQYKFMNESIKAKKEYLRTLMRTPENLISWLERPVAQKGKNFDPYEDDLL